MDKSQLLKSFQELKQEIEKLKNKHLVSGLVARFHTEKKSLEKRIEKTVLEEVKKAKKFMTEQKKELDKIQIKVENLLKKNKKPAQKTKSTSKRASATTAKRSTKKTSKRA